MQLRLPRLGEGADSGVVVNILVREGEKVTKDQTVIEIENEKAVAPIPASESGVVSKILVSVGDTISVGQPFIALGDSGDAPSKNEEPSVQPESKPIQAQTSPQPAKDVPQVYSTSNFATYQYQSSSDTAVPASPSIRKLARDIGLDLTRVQGTDRGGRITLDDVRNHVLQLQARAFAVPAATGSQPLPRIVDFEKFGPVERQALTSLRKKIGEQMSRSWSTVPHVTQFDNADVTQLLALSKKFKADYEKAGASLTLTVFILKALVQTLQKYPIFNASIDEANQQVVFKNYFNIGIAVDTENGLIVPVIRDVDKKSMLEIALELQSLAEKTRERKIALEDLQGGSFTVSNQGSIGGGHFTPIVNTPEVAILGIGRGNTQPVYQGKTLQARSILPVTLSYDHRLIDGGSAARFITDFVRALSAFDESSAKIAPAKKAVAIKKKASKKNSAQKASASRKGKR